MLHGQVQGVIEKHRKPMCEHLTDACCHHPPNRKSRKKSTSNDWLHMTFHRRRWGK